MRLDKFLVECGLGSRTQVKLILKKKQISVNGNSETSPKVQVDEYRDEIKYNGTLVSYEKFVYYMLHKPKGAISATDDPSHKTVLDLLDKTARDKAVFPVGRLDIDTTGLLLITNNGELAHKMLSPKKHVDKCYEAKISGIMTEDDILAFDKGIILKDFTCLPALLEIVEVNQVKKQSLVKITIKEGKFHQVKRMVAACGKEVLELKRLRMGNLQLDKQLESGQWRRLTIKEIEKLEKYMQ
ncbi:TPA: pseudouridine synthase [Streptococcus agalactiae]